MEKENIRYEIWIYRSWKYGSLYGGKLHESGYEMVVSNTHAKEAVAELAKQGAETVDTNGQVAEKAEIIFLCLPNGDVVESVIEELLDAENSIVKEIYDFSTIAPTTSQKLGKEGKENGYKYYDCPIAGELQVLRRLHYLSW